MTRARTGRAENRDERADRIAREIIQAERVAREKKTARLRELRLKMEQASAS